MLISKTENLSELEKEARGNGISNETLAELVAEYKEITGRKESPKHYVELVEVVLC